MRNIFYIAILLLSHFASYAQLHKAVADTEFFYLYGGSKPDEGRCIKETPDGGYIIAGTSSSFGPGNSSVYLIKTDELGKHLWSNVYGGGQNDWGYSIEVTADSGYFVCGFSNSFGIQQQTGYDTYYFKTDKNGNLEWQKTVAGGDWDFVYGSCQVADGGFILCGETYSNSNGGSDAYLIRLDKNGDTLWTKNYGGLFDEAFKSVAIINNRIYAVGENATHASDTLDDGWIVKLDTNGNVLNDLFIVNGCSGCSRFEETLLGITPYPNGLFHFSGSAKQVDQNFTVSILGRADTSLNIKWTMINSTGPADTRAVLFHVINLGGGNICALGFATGGLGGENMVLEGYDANGNFINDFIRHSGGAQNDYGYYGIYTSKDRIIGIGSSESFCTNQEDVFLVRLNGDTIQNSILTGKNPAVNCFADTLYYWAVSTPLYSSDLKLNLFPNPASDNIHLEITGSHSPNLTGKIFSLLGEELINFKIDATTTNTVDVLSLSNGSYFVKIQDEYGKDLSVLKLVINR